MESAKNLQRLVDRIRSGNVPAAELRGLIHHQSPVIRVNALEALAAQAEPHSGVVAELIAAAGDPVNKSRLMGTVSVAHVAVACLLRFATSEAVEAANALLNTWAEPDRTDLIWYLKSEGLQTGCK